MNPIEKIIREIRRIYQEEGAHLLYRVEDWPMPEYDPGEQVCIEYDYGRVNCLLHGKGGRPILGSYSYETMDQPIVAGKRVIDLLGLEEISPFKPGSYSATGPIYKVTKFPE